MLARLWWKEFRLFWPVWLFITLSALVAQWLALWLFADEARNGALMVAAIAWAFLYAAAVGSASFAAEREQKTLRFLDTLPVARDLLWRSKASFAMVTTLLLAVLLSLVSMIGTDLDGPNSPLTRPSFWSLAFFYFVFVIEAVGWGLFWSAITESALGAAAWTVCSIGVTFTVTANLSNSDVFSWTEMIGYRLIVAAIATTASLLILTRKPRPSPPLPAVRMERPARVVAAKPPRFWVGATRSLIWETFREMRMVWGLLVFAILVFPLVSGYLQQTDPLFVVVISGFASLMAGVKVFGTENRGQTYRFLAHQGAGAGVVWTVKMMLSSLVMLSVCIPAFALFMTSGESGRPRNANGSSFLAVVMVWMYGFSAAQLCGMLIRREITAGLVALVLTLALAFPMISILYAGLLAGWELFAIPLALILISRIWCADWLLDRPGFRPWIKLGLWTSGIFASIFIGYISQRAYQIPPIPTTIKARFLSRSVATISPDQNAAPLYLQAKLKLQSSNVANHELANDLIRKGASLPYCQFDDPERRTIFSQPAFDIHGSRIFEAIYDQTPHLISGGKLKEAWNNILVAMKVSRQFQNNQSMQLTSQGATTEHTAIMMMIDWANDSRQTPVLIEEALKDLESLPPIPRADDILLGQWKTVEQTLDLPKAEFHERFETMLFVTRPFTQEQYWSAFIPKLVTTPWEVERGRRVFAEFYLARIVEVKMPPWRRNDNFGPLFPGWEGDPQFNIPPGEEKFERYRWELDRDKSSIRLLDYLLPNLDQLIQHLDQVEVLRLGLRQYLALRAWQLKHDGNLPDQLSAIVPGELAALPLDPYSGKPFVYVRSKGQLISPPMTVLSKDDTREYSQNAEGRYLLLSVGSNRSEFLYVRLLPQNDDIVFVLPPAKNDPKIAPRPRPELPKETDQNGAGGASMMGGRMGAEMVKPTEPETPKPEQPKPELPPPMPEQPKPEITIPKPEQLKPEEPKPETPAPVPEQPKPELAAPKAKTSDGKRDF